MAVHMEKQIQRELIDAVIGQSLTHSMQTTGSKAGLIMGRF